MNYDPEDDCFVETNTGLGSYASRTHDDPPQSTLNQDRFSRWLQQRQDEADNSAVARLAKHKNEVA